VGRIENVTRNTPARYFPKIISISIIGRVSNISMVPPRFSSLNIRIVMAGIRNMKMNGHIEKNELISANPYSRTLVSGKTHINKPMPVRNTAIII
jgi:hypothetical protein